MPRLSFPARPQPWTVPTAVALLESNTHQSSEQANRPGPVDPVDCDDSLSLSVDVGLPSTVCTTRGTSPRKMRRVAKRVATTAPLVSPCFAVLRSGLEVRGMALVGLGLPALSPPVPGLPAACVASPGHQGPVHQGPPLPAASIPARARESTDGNEDNDTTPPSPNPDDAEVSFAALIARINNNDASVQELFDLFPPTSHTPSHPPSPSPDATSSSSSASASSDPPHRKICLDPRLPGHVPCSPRTEPQGGHSAGFARKILLRRFEAAHFESKDKGGLYKTWRDRKDVAGEFAAGSVFPVHGVSPLCWEMEADDGYCVVGWSGGGFEIHVGGDSEKGFDAPDYPGGFEFEGDGVEDGVVDDTEQVLDTNFQIRTAPSKETIATSLQTSPSSRRSFIESKSSIESFICDHSYLIDALDLGTSTHPYTDCTPATPSPAIADIKHPDPTHLRNSTPTIARSAIATRTIREDNEPPEIASPPQTPNNDPSHWSDERRAKILAVLSNPHLIGPSFNDFLRYMGDQTEEEEQEEEHATQPMRRPHAHPVPTPTISDRSRSRAADHPACQSAQPPPSEQMLYTTALAPAAAEAQDDAGGDADALSAGCLGCGLSFSDSGNSSGNSSGKWVDRLRRQLGNAPVMVQQTSLAFARAVGNWLGVFSRGVGCACFDGWCERW